MTNLEYLRRVAGQTQLELSKKVGCHPTLISRLERGWQTKVNSQLERKLLKVFPGWSVANLLTELLEQPSGASQQQTDGDL